MIKVTSVYAKHQDLDITRKEIIETVEGWLQENQRRLRCSKRVVEGLKTSVQKIKESVEGRLKVYQDRQKEIEVLQANIGDEFPKWKALHDDIYNFLDGINEPYEGINLTHEVVANLIKLVRTHNVNSLNNFDAYHEYAQQEMGHNRFWTKESLDREIKSNEKLMKEWELTVKDCEERVRLNESELEQAKTDEIVFVTREQGAVAEIIKDGLPSTYYSLEG